jgi:hypothetical protein
MAIILESGVGNADKLGITSENQAKVQAEIHELQHHVSWTDGQCYQTIGYESAITNTTQTILHIKNTSSTKNFVVSYMRLQIVGESGGTALPAAATFFSLGFGRTYSSGGRSVTPVNMNQTSGNVAALTCYDDSPTLAGTFTEFDNWYPDSGAMITYNKHGSLILGLNDTMEIRLTTNHTAGTGFARVTGFFIDA